MSLHKLTAGDGYTYLTRQVAVADSTERGYSSLGDYYAAKGESPGRVGRPRPGRSDRRDHQVSGQVTEQQMRNLFGPGIHPDADTPHRPAHRRRRRRYRRRPPRSKLGPEVPELARSTPSGARRSPPGTGSTPIDTRPPRERARSPADERETVRTAVADRLFTEPPRPAPGQLRGAVRVHRPAVPPGPVRGRRVRPHVLPGEVGVHPVGGRPRGGVGADRSRPPRRGRARPPRGSRTRPATPGSAPAVSRRSRPAG